MPCSFFYLYRTRRRLSQGFESFVPYCSVAKQRICLQSEPDEKDPSEKELFPLQPPTTKPNRHIPSILFVSLVSHSPATICLSTASLGDSLKQRTQSHSPFFSSIPPENNNSDVDDTLQRAASAAHACHQDDDDDSSRGSSITSGAGGAAL